MNEVSCLRINMKSFAGLAAQMAGMDQLSQQRAASVLGVLKALIKNVERAHHCVQPDQICRLQRTHLVAEAFLENQVDLLCAGDLILQDKGGLIHKQVRNAV